MDTVLFVCLMITAVYVSYVRLKLASVGREIETVRQTRDFWERQARMLRDGNKDLRAKNLTHTLARAGMLRDCLLITALNRKLINALEFYADEMGEASGEDSNYCMLKVSKGQLDIVEINDQLGCTERAGTMAKRILKEVNESYAAIRKQQASEVANAK